MDGPQAAATLLLAYPASADGHCACHGSGWLHHPRLLRCLRHGASWHATVHSATPKLPLLLSPRLRTGRRGGFSDCDCSQHSCHQQGMWAKPGLLPGRCHSAHVYPLVTLRTYQASLPMHYGLLGRHLHQSPASPSDTTHLHPPAENIGYIYTTFVMKIWGHKPSWCLVTGAGSLCWQLPILAAADLHSGIPALLQLCAVLWL
jgi:hypothetical protein